MNRAKLKRDYLFFAIVDWGKSQMRIYLLWIRLWPWVFLWGLMTLRHYVRDRRRRTRIRKGLCIRCGYDLRGSPERCPECGIDRETEAA